MRITRVALTALFLTTAGSALAQDGPPPTPAQAMRNNFLQVHQRLLDMAKDFPEDKYEYRATKDVHTFREIMLHALSGAQFAATLFKPNDPGWVEIDRSKYKTKKEVVALAEKILADCKARLDEIDEARWAKTLAPWPAVILHSGEQYGKLVLYYRLNNLVPPVSR